MIRRSLCRISVVALVLGAGAGARAQEPSPYLPDLMRFSETLGAITYLDDLCGDPDAEVWRIKMQGVIEAQAMDPADRRRTIDAYNRGYRTFASVHLACSDRTRAVLDRYMTDAVALADRIATRFGRARPAETGVPSQASPNR